MPKTYINLGYLEKIFHINQDNNINCNQNKRSLKTNLSETTSVNIKTKKTF